MPQNPSLSDFPDQPKADLSDFPDQPNKEKTLLDQWNEAWVNQPLIRKLTKNHLPLSTGVEEKYDPVEHRGDPDQWRMPNWIPGIGGGTYRSLGAGALKGSLDLIEGMTTPLNIATLGAFKGEQLAAKYGLAIPAEYLGLMGRGLSVPVMGAGAAKTLKGADEGNYGDVGMGVAEMAGGAAGAFHPGRTPAGLTKVADTHIPPVKPPITKVRIPPTEPPATNLPPGWLPFEHLPEGEYKSPTPVHVPEESQSGLPFGEPVQQPLDLGAYRSPAGRFARTGPSRPPQIRPFLEEPFQGHLDLSDDPSASLSAPFDRPQSPVPSPRSAPVEAPLEAPPVVAPDTPEAPVIEPPKTESGIEIVNGQERVTRRNWNDAQLKYWMDRGFVPGGKTADSQIYMVRNTIPPPEPPTQSQLARRGAIGPNEIPLNQNEVTIPTHQATDKTIAFLKTKGLELVGEENGQSTFKRVRNNESGMIDLDSIRRALRDWFGREPTPEEVQKKAFEENEPDPTMGERGRVAPFDRGFIPEEDQGPYNQPTDPSQLQDFLTNQLRPQIHPLPDIPNPDNIPGITRENVDRPGDSFGPQPDIQPPDKWDVPDEGGLDVGPFRQQNLFPPDIRTEDLNPPRPIIPDYDRPIPPSMGQQELPLGPHSELMPRELMSDAGIRPPDTGPSDLYNPPEPEQQSMIHDYIDAEITRYLQGEDATPPEMRDLDSHRPTGVVDSIKSVVKKFLDDETGTLDLEGMLGDIRRRIAERKQYLEGETEDQAIRRQRNADILEVLENSDPREAERMAEYWKERLRFENMLRHNTDAQKHASDMYRRAQIQSIDLAHEPPTRSGAIHPDVQEIIDGNREQLESLETNWNDVLTNAEDMEDYDTQQHAETMIQLIRSRYDGLARIRPIDPALLADVNQTLVAQNEATTELADTTRPPDPIEYNIEPLPPHPLSREALMGQAEARPTIEQLREKTGIPNPAFEYGPQEPKPRGQRSSISRAKYDRLQRSLQYEAGGDDWDHFAQDNLSDITRGQPGLSIEHSYPNNYGDKRFTVVYRGPDGMPVAMAEVHENSRGVRRVPTLAADRTKGWLAAKGTIAVTDKLFELNAAEASGTISKYTAALISKYAKFINDESGSYRIGSVVKALQDLKENVLKGKSLKSLQVDSPEAMDDVIGKLSGDKSFEWLLSKARNLASDETGALKLPSHQRVRDAVQGFFREGPNEEPSTFDEIIGFPTAATTTADVSIPLRQGFPTIFTKEWRQALKPMFQAGFSEEAAKKINAEIESNPIHQSKYDPISGKEIPSIAKQIGMTLIKDNRLSKSEYSIGSNWIENGGTIPYFSEGYRRTIGKYITKPSNRAASTFLNHLRTYTTERLLDAAKDMATEAYDTGSARPGFFRQKFTKEQALDLNPYTNLKVAKEIGDFVNTATGRAPLRTPLFPVETAPQINLEGAAFVLNRTMFSPKGFFTKVRMLNPNTYIMASPMVRKEYLKALVSAGAAWYMMTQLIKGGASLVGHDATVEDNMNSADFGKIRIGNTRMDPAAGFQQPIVLAHRLWTGQYKSSATGREFELGQGYRPPTRGEIVQNFMANKLNPVTKFAYDTFYASQHQPLHVADRVLQMYIPLIVGDLIDIGQEDPALLPGLGSLVALGAGTQTYDKGESVGKFIPPENDYLFTGGGNMNTLMPWNWWDGAPQQ